MSSKFWLVYTPSGSNPSHRHYSFDSAAKEANRLAEKHPGKEFFVVEAQRQAKATAVVIETHLEAALPAVKGEGFEAEPITLDF